MADAGDQKVKLDPLEEAVRVVRERDRRTPGTALILGSGLGGFAEELNNPSVFQAAHLPGYPTSSVAGHDGELLIGELEGKTLAIVRGRVHCYEGYDMADVVYPVRLLRKLGASSLVVTNAAGGIHPTCRPGSVMLISDHLNMAFLCGSTALRAETPISSGPPASSQSPASSTLPGLDGLPASSKLPGLRGSPASSEMSASPVPPTSRDMYDPEWLQAGLDIASQIGLPASPGVYVWTLGPAYETRAEIAFFAASGGHAVGMSTVPEVLQARALGMRVIGISVITNAAAGLEQGRLSHEDVLAVGKRMREPVRAFLRRLVVAIP